MILWAACSIGDLKRVGFILVWQIYALIPSNGCVNSPSDANKIMENSIHFSEAKACTAEYIYIWICNTARSSRLGPARLPSHPTADLAKPRQRILHLYRERVSGVRMYNFRGTRKFPVLATDHQLPVSLRVTVSSSCFGGVSEKP